MALNFSKEVITIGANKITDKTFTFFKQGFRLNGAIGEPEYRDVTVSGVDVLNLPNAKADGLNYCKLYGKCEQRNLPEGYTEVEYLRSSGTQWIDTGYKPNTNIKFEISGTQSNSDSALFGISEVFFCFDNGNATYYNFFGGSVGSFSATLKNVPIVLTMSASDGIVINGTMYKSLTAGSATANYPMALFGRRNNSTGAIDKLGSHRIKYAKIYENNILIHNYIPCRRNSDNVLGMYDTVTDNFLTNAGTGTFIAGNDVVPTPTRPLNIICNNGAVKVSPNLFDKSIFSSDTGTVITYTSYAVPNGVYTMSSPDFPFTKATNVFFLAGNVSTGASSSSNGVAIDKPITITVTDGYYTVGHRYDVGDINPNHPINYNWQIEKGSTPTTYMPYKQVYIDGTTETVEVFGKNSFNESTCTENYYISATGTITSSDVSMYSDLIKVKSGSTYTYKGICGTGASGQSGNTKRIHGYKNGVWIRQIKTEVVDRNTPFNINFVIPNDVDEIRISAWKTDSNVQIELGATATAYEPYYYGGQATAENLLSVGTYKDEQEVLTGAVTKNIDVITLAGNESGLDYYGVYSGHNLFYYEISATQAFKAETNAPLCTHYTPYSGDATEMPNNCARYQIGNSMTNYNRIYFTDDRFSTLADWKAFIAQQFTNGTPIIITTIRPTPTTSTVTAQTLTTQEGTNTIEITQASLTGLPLEVSYKAGVTVTVQQIENSNLDNQVTVTIGG